MISILEGTADLAYILGFALLSCFIAFIWSPFLIRLLYKFKVIKGAKRELNTIESQKNKGETPVMGGLLVIVTVAIITLLFNWSNLISQLPVAIG